MDKINLILRRLLYLNLFLFNEIILQLLLKLILVFYFN
jgi:hypothetical protein